MYYNIVRKDLEVLEGYTKTGLNSLERKIDINAQKIYEKINREAIRRNAQNSLGSQYPTYQEGEGYISQLFRRRNITTPRVSPEEIYPQRIRVTTTTKINLQEVRWLEVEMPGFEPGSKKGLLKMFSWGYVILKLKAFW